MSNEQQPSPEDSQLVRDRIAAARKRLSPAEHGRTEQEEDAETVLWQNWDNVWVQFNQR